MKELNVQERKEKLLKIMDVIHEYCVSHNIRYYLHAGTLLGAVRHNGYIPWDDDLDICMPRPDYEKFLTNFDNTSFYISSYKSEKRNTRPFSKVCIKGTSCCSLTGEKLSYGLGVDIFPIDGFPVTEKEINSFFKKQDFIFHYFYVPAIMCESKNPDKNFLRKIIISVLRYTWFKLFSSSYYARKIDKRAALNSFENSEFAGCSVGIFRRKIEKAMRTSYDSGMMHIFENKEYMIPSGYDDILTSLYGSSYMTPPPEDKRDSTHFEIYYED